jgi:4-alpha-glucanotransferase
VSTRHALRRDLNELARLHGVQRWYEDVGGERRHASPEAIFLTLRALGAPLESPLDVPAALAHRRAELGADGMDPVHTAWDGRLSHFAVRIPARAATSPAHLTLRLESGEVRTWQATFESAGESAAAVPSYRLRIPGRLPLGYHELEVGTGRRTYRSRIISAPRQAQLPPREYSWGLFVPLYSVRTTRDDGAGDFADLARLARWVGDLGGSYIGTLPLLATFVSEPFEPSPYSPVSRLFWNEFYVATPNERAGGTPRIDALVDYRAVAESRRRRLSAAAAELFRGPESELEELRRFAAARPRLADYARFRAVCDRNSTGWRNWPQRLRAGELQAEDCDLTDEQYYVYAQWQAERQLAAVGEAARAGSAALYLDLPLGVNPDGYDAWRFREVFAEGASAGAPPDTLFTGGQDWGFRPLSPDRLRATGYTYLIESVRHHLRFARMLRLDHVMSLFRLYWIPAGLSARDGVYVQYPADELLAVLLTESARHAATIVGEDLGTVPRAVRRAMERRRILRIYVVQYELAPGSEQPLNDVPRHAVASINTHDMPPFAAFLRAGEVDEQLDLGLVDADEALQAKAARAELVTRLARHFQVPEDARALLEAVLPHLAISDARTVLVNLEDLWLAEEPQNAPGTHSERPNWRRRFPRTLESLMADERIAATLRAVHERRCAAGADPATTSPNLP